jgi:diguanylate cyclase (GGDEF)-like protein
MDSLSRSVLRPRRINPPALLGAGLVLILTLAAAFQLQQLEQTRYHYNETIVAEKRVKDAAALLASAMSVRLNLTSSLSAFVTTHREFTPEEFDRFATMLKQELEGVISLQLAPNGVVTYLTDLERNRRALGHDLLADPKRRSIAEKSIRDRSYIIAGPINLIQGGRAIIARRPMFFVDADSGAETFWGFATVLIDIDSLLENLLVSELYQDFNIAIRGKDGLGPQGEVFIGQPQVFEQALATALVPLPDASWQIAISRKQAYNSGSFILSGAFYPLALVVGLAISFIAYLVFDRPRMLKHKIDQATLSLKQEVMQRQEAEKQVRFMAQHDVLTGLPNRLLFDELASKALASAQRDQGQCAILFLDIDGFKAVNDRLGHGAGDSLLQKIAERIQQRLRGADIVARFGGDEFTLLLTESCDIDAAQKVAGEIVQAISQPFQINGDEVEIGASVGIAIYPDHGHSIELLVKKADAAMYSVKDEGKSSFRLAERDDRATIPD